LGYKKLGGRMSIEDFMKTVYLGDRFIKEIVLDSYKREMKIKINEISRIRSQSGLWDYYNDENIEDGYLVFTEVDNFSMEPLGSIPNGELHDWKFENLKENTYKVTLFMGAHRQNGEYNEVIINLTSDGLCLEDPQKPSERIYE